jgi:NAD(P)-dependent dehydrogenase (short-subunit alcohol dehydrogenase family)
MAPRITSAFGRRSTAAEVAAGHDLSGRNVLITGGASGLGLETTRALAAVGANVTVAVRNVEAARAAFAGVSPVVQIEAVDLGDLESVRALAARWGDEPLHLLINNAGVMQVPEGRTHQGFETHIGVNHLAHFLLTSLLTPALAKAGGARVISLSSGAHGAAPFNAEDPNWEQRDYNPFFAYAESKSANALFALEYDRRERANGVRAFSLHPGVIHTPLMRHMQDGQIAWLMDAMKDEVKSPQEGAATTVWAATAPELEGQGGLYLEDCAEAAPAVGEVHGGVKSYVRDPAAAATLWAWSERAVG